MPERIQRRRTKGWRMPPNWCPLDQPCHADVLHDLEVNLGGSPLKPRVLASRHAECGLRVTPV